MFLSELSEILLNDYSYIKHIEISTDNESWTPIVNVGYESIEKIILVKLLLKMSTDTMFHYIMYRKTCSGLKHNYYT